MGKKVLLLVVLALALPTAAFADSNIDFTNSSGTLVGTTTGLSLSGSTLIAVNGFSGGGLITGNNLGTMSFSTGALSAGDLQHGGVLASGGTFGIWGNGSNGLPNGVIFNGTFSSPVTWALHTLPNGTHNYTLTGVVTGVTASGFSTSGVVVQLTINTGKSLFAGSTKVSSGDTNIVVPEPGTLTLFGTGLIGFAGVIRRKLKT